MQFFNVKRLLFGSKYFQKTSTLSIILDHVFLCLYQSTVGGIMETHLIIPLEQLKNLKEGLMK